MQKCNRKFHSEYASVAGKSTHISDYDKINPAFCCNGHLLVAVQGSLNRWHFRHKCANDTIDEPLSDWHAEWQSHFEHTEVSFTTDRGKGRRADAVVDCFVLEMQHSPITQIEVSQRTLDYLENGKTVLWIIDGEGVEVSDNASSYILTFHHDWKYSRFMGVGPIYIDVCGQMYQIHPQEVRSLTVTARAVPKASFIQAVKDGISPDLIWEQLPVTQNTLFVKQQGAGNGKTYGLVRMLASDESAKYAEFIYVTKQHSAKSIIYKEFKDQEATLGFTNVREDTNFDKKYVIFFTNKGKECSLTISTIDSFMFAVGTQATNRDMFEGILSSVVSENLKVKKNGAISFAGNRTLNAKTLFVVDETQDLSELYAKAVLVLMQYTNMDVYVVGDLLQSISNETNAFRFLKQHESAVQETDANICRRFVHPTLVAFVNHMTPFKKYGLPEVTPCAEVSATYSALCTKPLRKIKDSDKHDVDADVAWIMDRVEAEVDEHHYGPENFLIVTPWVQHKHGEFLSDLEIQLQKYWIVKMKDATFRRTLNPYWHDHDCEDYNRYVVIHRSQEGTSINLDESARATRCVSIHSAKGDGREVVFLLDPSEFKLSSFTYRHSLTYDSMIHVAITRVKKKMYILYENDAIGAKIKDFQGNAHGDTPATFNVNPVCPTTLLSRSRFMFDVHKAQFSGGADTQIVDMAHHNIRFGIMKMRALRYFDKHDTHNQLCTVLSKLHSSRTTVVECGAGSFTSALRKNNKTFPIREVVKNIPYLSLPTRHFETISRQSGEMLKAVHAKRPYAPMCPMETIIEYYMYEAFENGTKTGISINELYHIVTVYSRSFLSTISGHDCCTCNAHFKNETKGALTDYLTLHYGRMSALEHLVDLLCDEYPNASWNVDKTLVLGEYGVDNFCIKTKLAFVGETATTVIVVYLVPNLNSMNYADHVSSACIDRFIVQNCTEYQKTKRRYADKHVTCYLLALNEPTPYLLPVFADESVLLGIKSSMASMYSIKHHEVHLWFHHWMEEHSDNASKVSQEYARMNTAAPKTGNAKYITRFFEQIDKEYRNAKKKSAETKYAEELKESFVRDLEDELNESLDVFFEKFV